MSAWGDLTYEAWVFEWGSVLVLLQIPFLEQLMRFTNLSTEHQNHEISLDIEIRD